MDIETKQEKIERILGLIKTYVIPVIAFICSLVIAWSLLNTTVTSNAHAIEKLQTQCDENDELINVILQRLSSIDTKLDFIVKEIDNFNK